MLHVGTDLRAERPTEIVQRHVGTECLVRHAHRAVIGL